MTKKKISFILDRLFWGFIALLPLLVYLVFIIKNGTTYSLENVFNDFGFGIDTSSVIYQTFIQIFGVASGSSATIPAFLSNGVVLYISYMVLVELIHLIVDILLYIPRIAMKWLDKGVD